MDVVEFNVYNLKKLHAAELNVPLSEPLQREDNGILT